MVEMCRAFTAADSASSGRFGSLERAIVWVELHYSQRFSLDELARSAALSPATLNRRFRELMDCTPMDYVQKERLRRATLLLGDHSLNLGMAEIAERCGFVDAPHFSRLFSKSYGQSPRAWRRGLLQMATASRPDGFIAPG
jgi:transcriptional regulator GlxA family with amidase domain